MSTSAVVIFGKISVSVNEDGHPETMGLSLIEFLKSVKAARKTARSMSIDRMPEIAAQFVAWLAHHKAIVGDERIAQRGTSVDFDGVRIGVTNEYAKDDSMDGPAYTYRIAGLLEGDLEDDSNIFRVLINGKYSVVLHENRKEEYGGPQSFASLQGAYQAWSEGRVVRIGIGSIPHGWACEHCRGLLSSGDYDSYHHRCPKICRNPLCKPPEPLPHPVCKECDSILTERETWLSCLNEECDLFLAPIPICQSCREPLKRSMLPDNTGKGLHSGYECANRACEEFGEEVKPEL